MSTPTPYPVSTIISIGKVSQGLAVVDNEKRNAFKNGNIDSRLPRLIYLVRRSVEYAYDQYPLELQTSVVANYLYALCRRYVNAALNKLGQGGGGVIIDPGSGQPINLRWVWMSFTVGQDGSPINAGESSFTVNLTNILSDSAEFGYSGASPLPRTGTVPVDQQTYSPTYTPSNMTITLSYEVSDGEQYTLNFGRSSSGSSFNPPTLVLPTPYKEGQYLTNDGANLIWDNPFIEITSIDFETNGITYLNASLAYHDFGLFWNDLNRFLDSGEFTKISSGGFTINIAGFDANTNSYSLKIFTKGA